MSESHAVTVTVPAPRSNPVLLGHAGAEETLLRAAASGRLPHAWLIGGPPGIGKATLAFRFARFVLAGAHEAPAGLFGDRPTSLHLDPDHPTFRRVAAAGHADLLTVERGSRAVRKDAGEEGEGGEGRAQKLAKDLSIDEVREIGPFLHMTAGEGGWRVVVVDEAERMNRNSANAILKVLEEPPSRALILLVCNNPGALLPTIRSRCRHLRLEPLPEAMVAAFLEQHAAELPAADRLALARLAEGSIGRAVALVEEGGLELYRSLLGLLETLPRLDLRQLHKLSDQLGGAGAVQAYETVTDLLVWWLARLVRSTARGTIPPEVVEGEAALIRRFAAAHGLDRWMEVWEKTDRLFKRAGSANLDRKQVILCAFTSLEAAARA